MANIEEVLSELKIKISDLITENIVLKIDLDKSLEKLNHIESELEGCRLQVVKLREATE